MLARTGLYKGYFAKGMKNKKTKIKNSETKERSVRQALKKCAVDATYAKWKFGSKALSRPFCKMIWREKLKKIKFEVFGLILKDLRNKNQFFIYWVQRWRCNLVKQIKVQDYDFWCFFFNCSLSKLLNHSLLSHSQIFKPI